jgi:hypothetical protein
VADPVQRREQMAIALRKSKRMLVLSKKRWDLAMGQVQRMEEQYSGMESTHASEEQFSELAFSHLHEEQLDPFAAPPVTDLEHLFEFSTKYPESTDEQYMDLFDSARKRYLGREEEFYEA